MARFVNPRDFVQNLDISGSVNRLVDTAINDFNLDSIAQALQENAAPFAQLDILPRNLESFNINVQGAVENLSRGPLSQGQLQQFMGEIDSLSSTFTPSNASPTASFPGLDAFGGPGPSSASPTSSLPLPNSLKDFSSFNYILTLAVLTNEEINLPDTTIRQRPPENIVMRSSGGAGDSKPLTAFESNGNRIEFFMDDLEIKSVVTPNSRSRHSTATHIRFRVTEPYSMGLLPQALELACLQAGHRNYLEAPMAIIIEFIGYDSAGEITSLPDERRVIGCKWVSGQFNAGQSGSIYDMVMVPYNEIAYQDVVQNTPVDISVHGRTLNEMMQTGFNSVAAVLNTHLLTTKENTYVHEQDEYIFIFPKDRASFNTLIESSVQDQGATINPNAGSQQRQFDRFEAFQSMQSGTFSEFATQQEIDKLFEEQAGFSIKRSNLSEAIKQYNENDANVNSIGASAVKIDDPLAPGANPYIASNYEEEDGLFVRDSITIDPANRQIKFKQGIKVQRIIEELVCISDAGIDIGPNATPDNAGMVPWFRIETQVFNVQNTDQSAQSGRDPRIYVYRIVPYKVHHSVFAAPNEPYVGYDELYRQAAKEYDYIYTGKNDDVLDFNLEFKNTFYAALSPDGGNNASNAGASNGARVDDGLRGAAADTGAGNLPEGASTLETDARGPDSPSAGGVAETAAVRTARRFNDAIVNSDVDLMVADLTIWGDPFWLSDSGMGNYMARPSQLLNVNADQQADYQNGQCDIILNFRTPVDITDDGDYSFPKDFVNVENFSGLYMVVSITSMFQQGKFTQEMRIIRRRNQRLRNEATQESASPLQELQVPERLIAEMQDAGATPDQIQELIQSNIQRFGSINVTDLTSSIPGIENAEVALNNILSTAGIDPALTEQALGLGSISGDLTNALGQLQEGIPNIQGALQGAIPDIQGALQGAIPDIEGAVNAATANIQGSLNSAISQAQSAAQTAITDAQNLAQNAAGEIRTAAQALNNITGGTNT